MGFRFRKSFKILPGVRINLGKKGITSVTVGKRGASVNFGKRGTNANIGIPGTGLSYSQRLDKPTSSNSKVSQCPFCGHNMRKQWDNCPKCGEALLPDLNFSNNQQNDISLENNDDSTKTRFYQKTWFIILMLLFFAPIGIVLMYKYASWSKNTKHAVAAVFLAFFIYSAFVKPESKDTSSQQAITQTQKAQQIEQESTTPVTEQTTQEVQATAPATEQEAAPVEIEKITPVAPIAETTKKVDNVRRDGPGPNGETIKGNINSKGEKIYHMPNGAYYNKTDPEAWFFTREEAEATGYRASKESVLNFV